MDNEHKFTQEQAEEEFSKYGGKFNNAEDVETKILDKESKLTSIFKSAQKLAPLWDDFVDTFSLIRDYVTGKYDEVPWRVIAGLAGALLYVLSPIDLIPDLVPILGFADDAAVFTLALKFFKPDIERYRQWKAKHPN